MRGRAALCDCRCRVCGRLRLRGRRPRRAGILRCGGAGVAHFPVSTRLAMVTYFRPASWAAATASASGHSSAHFGELDQHRQIDAGENLDFRPAHHRNREIGRRAAEHVGQDGNAVAAVDAFDRLDDVLAALLDVIVGADRHRLDLALRTHDMLQGRAELDGQPPVGHQHKTNHETPRGRVPSAPHERLLILTIRSPSARGIFADIWRLLHCDS